MPSLFTAVDLNILALEYMSTLTSDWKCKKVGTHQKNFKKESNMCDTEHYIF